MRQDNLRKLREEIYNELNPFIIWLKYLRNFFFINSTYQISNGLGSISYKKLKYEFNKSDVSLFFFFLIKRSTYWHTHETTTLHVRGISELDFVVAWHVQEICTCNNHCKMQNKSKIKIKVDIVININFVI